MDNIFIMNFVATGCMPTKEVWIGDKTEFWNTHAAPYDNWSINYGAPIPSFELEDPAALLEFISPERWDEFAKIMVVQYDIDIMVSALIPILQAGWKAFISEGGIRP